MVVRAGCQSPNKLRRVSHGRGPRPWYSKYGSLIKETRAPWRMADFRLGLGKIQGLLSEIKEVLREK